MKFDDTPPFLTFWALALDTPFELRQEILVGVQSMLDSEPSRASRTRLQTLIDGMAWHWVIL